MGKENKIEYYLLNPKENTLMLYNRFLESEIYTCVGFRNMYEFIKDNGIPYNSILLKFHTLQDLFDSYIDINSLNKTKKGEE